ncbi:hypothetical protein G9A89_018106 [Geosiphon pyriformis]|nr:hypothetical protein G9A89_018106 [Geosiphon pyriformis]
MSFLCWMPFLEMTTSTGSEHSLPEMVMCRNKERDPYDRARIGYKVDAIIEYQNLYWNPVVGCLEVAGGLPRCSRSKEWNDILKLGLELWDSWTSAEDQLIRVDIGNLVYWGLIVVGREIKVYSLVASGGLFHLLLMDEASLPSSHQDLDNIKLVYFMLKEYKRELDATTNTLCEFNKKKIQLITGAKRKNLEGTPER